MFNAQSQGDAGKKKQVASDTPKPLDTAKAAANRAEVTTAKSSQDKAQQSDVGSSSDAGKSREISANFKYIGGNTDGSPPLTGEKVRGACKDKGPLACFEYANKQRADGRIPSILPERVVFRKRAKRDGQYQYSRSQAASIQVS